MPERPQDPKDWIRQNIVDETDRKIREHMQERTERGSGRRFASWRVALAFGAIALGVALFLSNVGILPPFDIWALWPVFLIVGGLSRLGSQQNGAHVSGVVLIAVGSFLLLNNLGWLHIRDGSWILPLILIAVGVLALFNVIDPGRIRSAGMARANQFWKARTASDNTMLGDFAVLGSIKRKVEGPNFKGGDLTALLGNIDLDLRRAVISPVENIAVLNTNVLMGAVKIRVPDHWRIHLRGVSVLGNFEDRTTPPNTGEAAPLLVIGGWSMMGSVEIED